MKKFVLIVTALTVMTVAQAQHDNIYVHNDSDSDNGCAYFVTPWATFCLSGTTIRLSGMARWIQPADDHTFTSSALHSVLGSGHQYIGAEVEGANGIVFLYSYNGMSNLEFLDETGDCQGGALNVVYDDAYITGTSELYMMDDQ